MHNTLEWWWLICIGQLRLSLVLLNVQFFRNSGVASGGILRLRERERERTNMEELDRYNEWKRKTVHMRENDWASMMMAHSHMVILLHLRKGDWIFDQNSEIPSINFWSLAPEIMYIVPTWLTHCYYTHTWFLSSHFPQDTMLKSHMYDSG